MPATPTTTEDSPDLTRDQALALVHSQQATLEKQQQSIAELQHQLDWFKKQLFGPKSERRLVENPDQLALGFGTEHASKPSEPEFYRLAQRPGSYVVMCYKQPVVKNLGTQQIARIDSPGGIFERSIADVSFLAGMLVDKFQFHIPLYRQHQRLESAQITLSRATLTNLTRRAIELLEPIADAQLQHILLSRVLAMDETPIKAGKSNR